MNTNHIGARGESIFSAKVSKNYLLVPSFLGEKYESIDFIVNLNKSRGRKAFCFVSVKTTTQVKYKAKTKRIKVSVNNRQLSQLKKFKIPTYIVAIDETNERGFIVCVRGIKSNTISSIPTKYSLNRQITLQTLWDEVNGFWISLKENKIFNSKLSYV